ncbi:MAG: adenine-specific methyltransferase EcoRI family protein [Synergistaceae bacterium]|nr:adenine-specific methyltransferase EcoRI family protein [Synergistaceae bacterium]
MGNEDFKNAKRNKNDEFYTRYNDIQKEINAYLEYDPNVFRDKTVLCPCDDPEWSNFTKFFAQNFERFGLKKLISTSYAADSKKYIYRQLSLFESENPKFDKNKTNSCGKKFILERDVDESGRIDIDDLEFDYLDGDGDFRSKEVKKLRDEVDFIITNPPFSLFREFLAWIVEAGKKFLIIGNINCITYKEVFPLIMKNEIWLGNGMGRYIAGFFVPDDYELYGTEARIEDGRRIISTNNGLWLTNIEHGRRHEPLLLMTMADNLKFSKHKDFKERGGYLKYDNYDAIDVPYTDVIPDDYNGVMGVPITYLDKHCPEQYEILGCTYQYGDPGCHIEGTTWTPLIAGKNIYKRIFIRKRKDFKPE